VADLFLDESLRVVKLHQMGHVGVAQRMQIERRIDACQVADSGEDVVGAAPADPGAAFGQPERRPRPRRGQGGAHLVHVVAQDLRDPAHLGDSEDCPSLRRSAARRLPVPDGERAARRCAEAHRSSAPGPVVPRPRARVARSRNSSGYFFGAAMTLILRELRASTEPGALQRSIGTLPQNGFMLY